MENTGELHIEKDIHDKSLVLASVILVGVSRTISGIQILVVAILSYVMTATFIINGLIKLGEQIITGQAGKSS